MRSLEMVLKEEALQPLVNAWKNTNRNIVKLWQAEDNAVITEPTANALLLKRTG